MAPLKRICLTGKTCSVGKVQKSLCYGQSELHSGELDVQRKGRETCTSCCCAEFSINSRNQQIRSKNHPSQKKLFRTRETGDHAHCSQGIKKKPAFIPSALPVHGEARVKDPVQNVHRKTAVSSGSATNQPSTQRTETFGATISIGVPFHIISTLQGAQEEFLLWGGHRARPGDPAPAQH